MTIKAIQTNYQGYKFRSRLEAKWAVAFNALEVEWEYEVEGYDVGSVPRQSSVDNYGGHPLDNKHNPEISCDLSFKDEWYMPDFWLPTERAWVEIKGKSPSRSEIERFRRLCAGTGEGGYLVSGGKPENFKSLRCNSDVYYANWTDSLLVKLCGDKATSDGKFNTDKFCNIIDSVNVAFKSARFGKGGRG